MPHKLHFGNRLRASILPWEIANDFTSFTRLHLLFRKRSLGMQQWTKFNAVQHLAAHERSDRQGFELQNNCTQPRSTRGENLAGSAPLAGTTRTSNPSVRVASAPPLAFIRVPVERRK